MPEGAEHETVNAWNRAELSFLGCAPLTPLTRDKQLCGAAVESWCIATSQMVRQRRKTVPIEVVLEVTRAAMHGPELMPHRRALRRVLVDDQMVDEPAANPVSPMQCSVAEWRPEHIATDRADANPPILQSASLQLLAKLAQQRREVLADQIPPGLRIEFIAEDVDTISCEEICTHGFIEA